MMLNNPNYATFAKDDIEALTIIHIFKTCDFVYDSMSGRPLKFEYLMLKDIIKLRGLNWKNCLELLVSMCKTFIKHLPKS